MPVIEHCLDDNLGSAFTTVSEISEPARKVFSKKGEKTGTLTGMLRSQDVNGNGQRMAQTNCIIESQMSTEDWRKEMMRIARDLDRIYENVAGKQFSGEGSEMKLVDQWKQQYAKLQGAKVDMDTEAFTKLATKAENELERVSRGEGRINKYCADLVKELQGMTEYKNTLQEKLRILSEVVQSKILHFDQLVKTSQKKIEEVKAIEEDAIGENNLRSLQNALEAIRVYLLVPCRY
jgi:hypothetical protein